MAREKKDKEATENVVADTEMLPKAIVRRVVRDKLSQLSTTYSEMSVLHDSLLAFSESARIFIHYLFSNANDICKESKRRTINAEDVFNALEEMGFPEFIEPLRASLEEFRNAGRKARSKAKESNSKGKGKEPPPPAPSEGRSKQREVEDGDENNSD